MRKATRIAASLLGLFAGFGGPEHGFFEIAQGSVRPAGLVFPSMGPPCDPETAWHACEPAITIIPNLLVTGILAMVVGLVTMIWSVAFAQKKYGGIVLILLSIALLLVGGGVAPPVIGIVAGAVATRINKPLTGRAGRTWAFLARLWPWPLVAFFVWSLGQFLVGHFSNELLQKGAALSMLLMVGFLVLSIVTARAYDASDRGQAVL